MANWSNGYISDIGYTHGFYRELTPALLSFVALNSSTSALRLESRPLRFCELGCGQGFSANLLAAANPEGSFYANDFNPSQVAGAITLANEARLSNIQFFEASFSEFSKELSTVDNFDVIVLHGVYSWIDASTRSQIVELITSKLNVGGFVYISYNALPGWAAGMPLRQLFSDHASQSNGPIGPRVEGALEFVEQLKQVGAGFFKANPSQSDRLDRIKQQDRSYLAHEYFNRDWTPFYHSQVATALAEAKLTFLGSAALLESVNALNLTSKQLSVLDGISDPIRRETVKDFIVNQQFRRDVFVKGPLLFSPRLAHEGWMKQRFALSTPRAEVPLIVRGALGEANLAPDVYDPILDSLSAGPKTLQQMGAESTISALGWERVTQALTVLVGMNHVQPALPAKDESKRRASTAAFNRAVLNRARDNANLSFLASPVTGGGIPVDRISQLFLLAIENGVKQAEGWAEFALSILLSQNQRIVRDGRALETMEENRIELMTRAATFRDKSLPLLQSLQII